VKRPVALTIAGVDSSGGAGIAADLKTFAAHHVWGTCAVTAVTAQNTLGVQHCSPVPAEIVRAQVMSVVADVGVDAAKTGMLLNEAIVEAVVGTAVQTGITRLVVDPVLASGHGDSLAEPEAIELLRDELVPLATVVTPNLAEAARLAGGEVASRRDMEEAGRAIAALGPDAVLVTGGHLDSDDSPDVLVVGGEVRWLDGARLDRVHTHGSGCVLSAAICAELARGMEAADACIAAKRFVERAIASGVAIGSGIGPVEPDWERLQSG
jgi:hydroxymethylpyrimidine/phosphomethylpyrimidine kinase